MNIDNNNILTFSFKHSSSLVAYCALSTKSGTRDENPKYNGLAHFTEHMLFKGTAKRKSESINNTLERVGGELNAYTTKEETVLHATVLKEDLPKAIDLLLELAFTSTFPQKELEKERDVVLDEIVSYKDMPSEAIYEHFEQLLFENHPLNMQILGEKKTLMRINTQIFLSYMSEKFIPSNMAFTVVADYPVNKVVKMIENSAAKFIGKKIGIRIVKEGEGFNNSTNQNSNEQGLDIGKKFNISFAKKNHQAHCIVGSCAYSCMSNLRVPLALLTNILGGPASGSKLNMALREKNGLVYNVEANYTPYADTGIFNIYFGCDKEDVNKCLSLIKKELDKLVQTQLSEQALRAAKKQLLGQLSIAQDNAEAQCLSMGKSLIVYGKISNFEQTRQMIENVSSKQLQDVAKQILSWDRMSILIYN